MAQTQSRLSRSFARTLQTQAANMAMTGSSRLRLDSAWNAWKENGADFAAGALMGNWKLWEKRKLTAGRNLRKNRQRLEMIDGELEKFSEEDLKRKLESSEKGLESCQMPLEPYLRSFPNMRPKLAETGRRYPPGSRPWAVMVHPRTAHPTG